MTKREELSECLGTLAKSCTESYSSTVERLLMCLRDLRSGTKEASSTMDHEDITKGGLKHVDSDKAPGIHLCIPSTTEAKPFTDGLRLTLRTLLDGLASRCELTRVQCSKVLGEILREFSDVIALDSIVHVLDVSTRVGMSGHPAPERVLGCLLGYSVLAEGNFFSTDGQGQGCTDQVIHHLWSIYEAHVQFRDAVARVVWRVLISMEGCSESVVTALNSKCEPWMDAVLEVDPTDPQAVDKSKGVEVYGFLLLYFKMHRWRRAGGGCLHVHWLKMDGLRLVDKAVQLLTSREVICQLHPRIPGAWREMCFFLVERKEEGLKQFQKVMEAMMMRFFRVGGGQCLHLESERVQNAYYSLRWLVETLGVLKQAFMKKGTPEASFLHMFWSFQHIFLPTLIFYRQGSQCHALLREAAQVTMSLLVQIVTGFQAEEVKGWRRARHRTVSALNVCSAGVYVLDDPCEDETALQQVVKCRLPASCTLSPQVLLQGLTRANKLVPLQVSTLSDLVQLTFSCQETKQRREWIDSWFSRPVKNLQEWLWRLDFGLQVALYGRFEAIQHRSQLILYILLSVLGAFCFPINDPSVENALIFYEMRMKRKKRELCCVFPSFFQVSSDAEAVCIGAFRRAMSRLGPCVAKSFEDLSVILDAWCQHDGAVPPRGVVDSSSPGKVFTLDTLYDFIESSFLLPFSLLNRLLGTKKKKKYTLRPVAVDETVCQIPKESKKNKKRARIADAVVFDAMESGVLSRKEAKMCGSFGKFISRKMIKLVQWMKENQREFRKHDKTQCHDLLLLLACMTFLPLRCFFFSCDAWSSQEEDASLVAQGRATLLVLKDIEAELKGSFEAALDATRKPNGLLFQTILQKLVDTIPELVLQEGSGCYVPLNPVFQSVNAASQSLLSCSFLTVWRTTCHAVSPQCLQRLIEGLSTTQFMGDPRLNDSTLLLEEEESREGLDSPLSREGLDSPLSRESLDSPLSRESLDSPLSRKGLDSPLSREGLDSPLSRESVDEEIHEKELRGFLLNDDQEGGVVSALGGVRDPDYDMKIRRSKQHVIRLDIQQKLRRVDLVDMALERKSSSGSEREQNFHWFMERYGWLIQLYSCFKSNLHTALRLVKKKKKVMGRKNTLQWKLYQDLCRRLDSTVSRCCEKLTQEIQKVPLRVEEENTREHFLREWEDLKEALARCTCVILKPLADQGQVKSFYSLRVEECGALLMLTGGALEEKLFSRQCKTWGTAVVCQLVEDHIAQAGVCLTLKRTSEGCETDQTNKHEEGRESVCSIEIPSSGLLFCDAVCGVLYAWVHQSHPGVGERFFRSLSSYSKRLFTEQPVYGLIGVPFAACGVEARRLFVLREALAVSVEILECFLPKATKKKSDDSPYLSCLDRDHLKTFLASFIQTSLSCDEQALLLSGLPFLWMYHLLCFVNILEKITFHGEVSRWGKKDASFPFKVSLYCQKDNFIREMQRKVPKATLMLSRLPWEIPEPLLKDLKTRLDRLLAQLNKMSRGQKRTQQKPKRFNPTLTADVRQAQCPFKVD